MTDFKAPPPPKGFTQPSPTVEAPSSQSTSTPEAVPVEAPVEETETSLQPAPEAVSSEPTNSETKTAAVLDKAQGLKQKVMERFNALPSNKRQVIVAIGIFVIGLLMGSIMFGGSGDTPAPAPKGLQGVVSNPDIKEPLKRCGQVEASSPCVLYVMNSYTYEKLAEDFFETAVSVTRRKDLVIRMDNVRYATMRIPPGYFAQIKIPAYK